MTGSDFAGANGREPPRLLLAGIDSLYVGYYLDTSAATFDWDEIQYQKERVQQSRSDDYAEIELGSERFALRPSGRHPYTYVFENRAFHVALGEHIRPSCYVQFLSEALWKNGAQALHRRLLAWAESVGLTPAEPEGLSRVDLAFDFALDEIDFSEDHFVTRAKKDGKWRGDRRAESFQFGTGDVVVRVYDKAKEIEQASGKAFFHQLWGQSEGVWRIEFQVRKARLRTAGVVTMGDLAEYQGDLLCELVTNHTSLRLPDASDSNRSRWPLHPLWRALQAAIGAMPQHGLVESLSEVTSLEYRLHQQLTAIYGYCKGAGATLALIAGEEEAPTLGAVLGKLRRLLAIRHQPADWDEEVTKRMRGYALGKW